MKKEEINKYLEDIITSNPYNPITFNGQNTCYLNRWVVTSVIEKKNIHLYTLPLLNTDAKIIHGDNFTNIKDTEIEENWRYYISNDASSFYKRNSPEIMFGKKYDYSKEKYIYCLSNVFCKEQKELIIHISTMLPMPLRVWINGKIIFSGNINYFIKNHIASYVFKKGNNTILVEKPMIAFNRKIALTPKFFSITIRTIESVVDNSLSKYIQQKSLLNNYFNSYTILFDKAFYRSGEKIYILLLSQSNKQIGGLIRLIDSNNIILCQQKIILNKIIVVHLPRPIVGVIKVIVENNKNKITKYIFMGDYNAYRDRMIKNLLENNTISNEIIYSIKKNLDILDVDKGFINGTIEPIHEYYVTPILKYCFNMEKWLKDQLKDNIMYNGESIKYIKSSIDDGDILYNQYIPYNYSPNGKYPLVVFINFDDSSTRIPLSPYRVIREIRDDVLTLTFCTHGEYFRDFIYEMEILSIIDRFIKEYNVDQNNIFLIGVCIGSKKGFKFINKIPHMFTSMIAFSGTATTDGFMKEDELVLHNLNNIPIYQLCLLDDIIFNGGTIINTAKKICRDIFILGGYEHEEFIDYFCNAHIIKLFNKTCYNKFPSKIIFNIQEPPFNQAYWIIVKGIDNILIDAHVEAEIVNSTKIVIKTTNVNSMILLINRSTMGLLKNIWLCINNQEYTIDIYSCCVIKIIKKKESYYLDTDRVDVETFNKKYNNRLPDINKYGIKEIFLKKCYILNPVEQQGEFYNDIINMVTKPIKNRSRNYKFAIINEFKLDYNYLSESNFISIINSCQITSIQQTLINDAKIQLYDNELVVDDIHFNKDYYAFIKLSNPYNKNYKALFIIYHGEDIESSLLCLLDEFEKRKIFYSKGFVYSYQRYYIIKSNSID